MYWYACSGKQKRLFSLRLCCTVLLPGSVAVIDDGKYIDSLCQLSFECTKCGRKTYMATSKRITKNSHEINLPLALAMAELGLGKEAMTTFSSVIGMRPPSVQYSWDKNNQSLSSTLDAVLEKQYENAMQKLRQSMIDNGDLIDAQPVVYVVASNNGTWHHRKFKASHGIEIVMSVDMGEFWTQR